MTSPTPEEAARPEELAKEVLRLEADTKGIKSAVTRWERDQRADAFSANHCPTIATAYLDLLKRVEELEGDDLIGFANAIRAVDAHRANRKRVDPDYEGALYMEYLPGPNPSYEVEMEETVSMGNTLPEAICNLLLKLAKTGASGEERGE